MIKAIIFDLGGVLFTWSEEADFKILRKIMTKEQYQTVWHELSDMLDEGKITYKEVWSILSKNLGKPINVDKIRNELLSAFKPIAGMRNVVIKLKKNYKIGLLSNHNEMLPDLDKKYHFKSDFDEVVISYEVGYRKPDSKIYKIILRRMKVKPEHSLFIDDNERNVKAAIDLKMKGIVFKNSKQLLKELKKLGVKI
jgi:epoxide hydrolase-like predicted phosphatase